MQILDGVRVLDLTHHIAGPYCTRLLADLGADVIKVERPGHGDVTRRHGPFPGDRPDAESSGLFLYLNMNKRGVTLDLKSAQGRGIALDLVKWANVVVENFAPSTLSRFGLGYDAVREVNPGVVMTSISNFGQTGPYRDYKAEELVAFAMGGPMNITGALGEPPSSYARNVPLHLAGMYAAVATLMALYRAEAQGTGEWVDLSLLECMLCNPDRRVEYLLSYQYTGVTGVKHFLRGPAIGVYPCKDGYVSFSAHGERFERLLKMMDRLDLASTPQFSTQEARSSPEAMEVFDTILLEWLMQRTMREIWTEAQRLHVLCAPIYTPADVFTDPHYQARGFWTEVRLPAGGLVRFPGTPVRFHGAPAVDFRPAPRLGEHNAHVYGGLLGYSPGDIVRLTQLGVV